MMPIYNLIEYGNNYSKLLKIVKKRLHSLLCTFSMVWLLTILTYTQIEHAKKSTCLFNTGFCQPICIRFLMLKEYCVVA